EVRHAMYGRIASLDQFGPAELSKLFPVFLEHVEGVPVFKVLEGHESLTEPRAEVARELAFPHDVSVMSESIEHQEPFACHCQPFPVRGFLRGEMGEHAIRRSQ